MLQVWAPPYRVKNDKKTGEINHTRRCSIVPLRSTGQLLSRVFVVLLRKSIPQSRNLKAAAELNVIACELF